MKYAVNEEGVQAMKKMSDEIRNAIETMNTLVSSVKQTADGNQNTLGPHKASLDDALADIKESLKKASEPAEGVAEKLDEVAEAYTEVIGNDVFKGAGGK